MGRHTFSTKNVNTVFRVRNIAQDQRTIRIFGIPIYYDTTRDLLRIPEISEADIRHSLLKGELKEQKAKGFITVTESTIDLTQFDSEQRAFLQSLGISSGIASSPDAVANISELSILDDALFVDGTSISVRTILDDFVLVNESTETIDNITIVSTKSDVGRWHRKGIPNNYWRRQLVWFMDSVNGDDENVGDTETNPIKTFEEFRRRHGKLLCDPTIAPAMVTFTILDTGEVEQNFIIDMKVTGAFNERLAINGSQTTIYSGSVTGYVPWNVGTQQEPELADTALPVSWTASGLVHKRMILTSGDKVGATGYVSRDLGSKTAGMPLLLDTDFNTMVEPTVGNTYDIVDQTRIKGVVDIDVGEGQVAILGVEIDGSGGPNSEELIIHSGVIFVLNCATLGSSNTMAINRGLIIIYGGLCASSGGLNVYGGTWEWHGALISMGSIKVWPSAATWFFGSSVLDASGSLELSNNAYASIMSDTLLINCGSTVPVELKVGALFYAESVLWGTTGNTPTHAFKLGSMATIVADVENLKIEGGSTNDILLGSTAVAYEAGRPMVDANSEAKVLDLYNP
jgi:hypothetical protein